MIIKDEKRAFAPLVKILSLWSPSPGCYRMAWRWRGSAWGTSSIITTPNEACGTPRTRNLLRDSAPCGPGGPKPTCRSTVCERDLKELAHCLTLPFFLNRHISGMPLFLWGPLLYVCLYEEAESESELCRTPSTWLDPESSPCLTNWTTERKICLFFSLFGAMFSDKLKSSLCVFCL